MPSPEQQQPIHQSQAVMPIAATGTGARLRLQPFGEQPDLGKRAAAPDPARGHARAADRRPPWRSGGHPHRDSVHDDHGRALRSIGPRATGEDIHRHDALRPGMGQRSRCRRGRPRPGCTPGRMFASRAGVAVHPIRIPARPAVDGDIRAVARASTLHRAVPLFCQSCPYHTRARRILLVPERPKISSYQPAIEQEINRKIMRLQNHGALPDSGNFPIDP